jgi:hypothetical protein
VKRLAVAALAALAIGLPAFAKDSADVAFVRRLFTTQTVDASLFDDAFLQRVPVADVQTLVDGYRQRLGALKGAAHDPGGERLTFARGSLRATLDLDPQGKAAGLRFHDEQSDADARALERVLRARNVTADWFSQGFLDQFSAAQVDAQNAQLRATEGAFVRLESRTGVYYAVFERAENIVEIETARSGKIAYLRLLAGTPRVGGP